jgi:hypothetical protein
VPWLVVHAVLFPLTVNQCLLVHGVRFTQEAAGSSSLAARGPSPRWLRAVGWQPGAAVVRAPALTLCMSGTPEGLLPAPVPGRSASFCHVRPVVGSPATESGALCPPPLPAPAACSGAAAVQQPPAVRFRFGAMPCSRLPAAAAGSPYAAPHALFGWVCGAGQYGLSRCRSVGEACDSRVQRHWAACSSPPSPGPASQPQPPHSLLCSISSVMAGPTGSGSGSGSRGGRRRRQQH